MHGLADGCVQSVWVRVGAGVREAPVVKSAWVLAWTLRVLYEGCAGQVHDVGGLEWTHAEKRARKLAPAPLIEPLCCILSQLVWCWALSVVALQALSYQCTAGSDIHSVRQQCRADCAAL